MADTMDVTPPGVRRLVFGATAPTLAKQLGRKPDAAMKVWQKDADAITRLLVRDLIPQAVGRSARMKLLRRMADPK